MNHIDTSLRLNTLILLLGEVTSAALRNLEIFIALAVLFPNQFVDIRAADHLEVGHELRHSDRTRAIEVNRVKDLR